MTEIKLRHTKKNRDICKGLGSRSKRKQDAALAALMTAVAPQISRIFGGGRKPPKPLYP